MRILNLGAGVQSTAIYLMMIDGDIPPADAAVFADTGDEPQAVYDHLRFLKTLGGPKIYEVSRGSLGDNLKRGVNSNGQRFVSIPTFLSREDNGKNDGIGRRQCTKEYKLRPIRAEIRRLCGVGYHKWMPKDLVVTQVFGLSYDEPRRVARVRDQFRGQRNYTCEFPLFDDEMTRADCVAWLRKRLPEVHVPRSACVFCPYKSDEEWLKLKNEDPKGWARAVEIDHAIRNNTSACTRGMNAAQYLHRSCQPLELVQLSAGENVRQKSINWPQMDCEGMCGV